MVRVRAAKGSEWSRMGCNRSVVVTHRGSMSRFSYLTVCKSRRMESVSEHKVFFNSRKGRKSARSGRF